MSLFAIHRGNWCWLLLLLSLWWSVCPLNTPLPWSSDWNLPYAGLFGQVCDNCRRRHGASAPGRAPFISRRRKHLPAPPQLSPHASAWKLCQLPAASPGRKRTCPFKFSAGNWHFIIYVVHVIMLDNITNDAIRSTGNLKWCTPVLTWERSAAHIQPPQLKASSRQRLCTELCSQTDR